MIKINVKVLQVFRVFRLMGNITKTSLKCSPKHSVFSPLLCQYAFIWFQLPSRISFCTSIFYCNAPMNDATSLQHTWRIFFHSYSTFASPSWYQTIFLLPKHLQTSSSISPKSILTVPSPNNDTTVDTTFLGLSQESSTDPTY